MHDDIDEKLNDEQDITVFTSEETSDIGYVLCCLTPCIFPLNFLFLLLTDRTTYVVRD